MLSVVLTGLAAFLGVFCLIVQFKANRLAAVCLFLFWSALGAALWGVGGWLWPMAGVLLLVALGSMLAGRRGSTGASSGFATALGAEHAGERESGLQRAAELATPEAWDALVLHSGEAANSEDGEELLSTFRALLRGWGPTVLIGRWQQFADPVRMRFLELVQDASGFDRAEVLAIARRGMEDSDVAIARRAWRTYAYSVTFAVERQLADFDFATWYAQCADDPHQELQALRSSLEKKRLAEADNQGIDVMVARYRREVFKSIPARQVCLVASQEYEVSALGGECFRFPAGRISGSLSGLFDNAQDAIMKGWQLGFQWSDEQGNGHRLDCSWQASALFAEVLAPAHDARRDWLDCAPEEVLRALALQPVVGPAVAWADELDQLHPQIQGEPLTFGEEQLLSCLIAQMPTEGSVGTELVLLMYESQDSQGDEIRPFVTVLPLELLLLGARPGQRVQG